MQKLWNLCHQDQKIESDQIDLLGLRWDWLKYWKKQILECQEVTLPVKNYIFQVRGFEAQKIGFLNFENIFIITTVQMFDHLFNLQKLLPENMNFDLYSDSWHLRIMEIRRWIRWYFLPKIRFAGLDWFKNLSDSGSSNFYLSNNL